MTISEEKNNILDTLEKVIEEREKTCFIITPIGDENTTIRRHIDGMIDGVIFPILERKGYKMEVAHRITTPGSINKQVISKIYSADLVIANLTELNPNVMYELAFRHATKKPVIMIMERGEKRLPFDVNSERTIFYENDFQGAIDLKERILNTIDTIEQSYSDIDNPIYTALESISEKETVLRMVDENTSENKDALKYIINKLDTLDIVGSNDLGMYREKAIYERFNIEIYFGYNGDYTIHDFEINENKKLSRLFHEIYLKFKTELQLEQYSYLEKWILREVNSKRQLIVREICELIYARDVFEKHRTWELIILDKPYVATDSKVN